MTTATAVKGAERKLVISGKEIIGFYPLKPQQKKLEELLSSDSYTPSDVRNTLRINLVVVIKENELIFWEVQGTNVTRSDAAMPELDRIMAMDIPNEKKALFIQGALGIRTPIYIDDERHQIIVSRF